MREKRIEFFSPNHLTGGIDPTKIDLVTDRTATDPRIAEGKSMGRALREGWRRREIRQAVGAFFVLNRRAAKVEDIAAITGRSVEFTAARLDAVEGVEITPAGVLPADARVAAVLRAGKTHGSKPAFATTKPVTR